jgi:hypothetical protein
MSAAQDEEKLRRYIERQYLNLKTMVPGWEVIDFDDFADICMIVLDEAGVLTTTPQPNGELRRALRPEFVPQARITGVIAAVCDARVRAIRTGAAEWLVQADSSEPEWTNLVPSGDNPVLEPDLEMHVRELQQFFAARVPEYGVMPFDEFLSYVLPGLAFIADAVVTERDGRSVWRPTRQLKTAPAPEQQEEPVLGGRRARAAPSHLHEQPCQEGALLASDLSCIRKANAQAYEQLCRQPWRQPKNAGDPP